MREFFHGWRRKTGVVLLVMACVVMAGWIRSRLICDVVAFPFYGRQQSISTIHGRIYWVGMRRDDAAWDFDSNTDIAKLPAGHANAVFANVRKEFVAIDELQYRDLTIPHWSGVLPLTLLSAYLILWKPRKQHPTATKPHA